jgi:hypothetical protein
MIFYEQFSVVREQASNQANQNKRRRSAFDVEKYAIIMKIKQKQQQ